MSTSAGDRPRFRATLGITLIISAPELWLSGLSESGLALAVIIAVVDGETSASDMVPASFGPLGPISHIW